MEITISCRHMQLSESMREATRRKIDGLSRFNGGMERAVVHFTEEKNPRITESEVCEVVMEGHGKQIRCKVSASDPVAAVDLAVAKLEHQLAKLKTKNSVRG